MSEETEDIGREQQIDNAFIQSENHQFNGAELQPWTPSRLVAAQSIGLRYPNISDEDREQFRQTGIYPGALKDIAIVLWICTLVKPEEIRRAGRQPDDSYEQAVKWADGLGITNLKSECFWKAYDRFIKIVSEERVSISHPKIDKDEDVDDPKT